jgi:subtilisin family serine protease
LAQFITTIYSIEKLAEWSEIRLIKKPFKPQINSITSEGVNVIGANYWHNGGLTGEGVKIGVIDGGFKDYDSLLGTELPISVITKIMGSYSDFISNKHGTACTEIVHDVAPDAELYLVNAGDYDVDFHNAVSWLRSQNVNVISSSIGLNLKIYCGLLYEALRTSTSDDYILYWIQYSENLKDQWDSTINSAINQGTTWTQAAGNDGQKKWIGLFNDSDGDFYLNFSSYENYNEIELPSYFSFGQEIYVTLFWGFDTDLTYDDYDLYITDEFGFTIDSSRISQLQFPIGMEACKFTPITGKKYYVWVLQYWAVPREISLIIGLDDFANLKHYAPQGTIKLSPPAHNPNVITMGAVPYSNPYNIEPYSSQGPNNDGVIKPDLVAPDYVSTESYGASPFQGTSAAAPHVAGACALVKQIYPGWSPSQIKNYLESNAIELGTSGKDNTYGSGLVMLPTPLSGPPTPPIGFMVATNLWIGSVVDTEEKGPVEAVWKKGGEGTTSAGDRVIWGYFYASPSDVTWGSQNNPDCFVKIWFDHGGRVDVNFFHVSVPDIEVFLDYPYDGTPDEQGTITMSRRYIRKYYENGKCYSEDKYEDGNPPSGCTAMGNPSGCSAINDLRIGSIINTVEKGPIDAVWRFGGQDTTARGDQVVWGHFYANPSDVTWGSQDNPDLFVKIWFDVSGRVDVNYFHVSVPDIEVYSDLPDDGTYDQKSTTIMDNRYIRHEYWR